jgi:hypothetical protein
MRRRILTAGLLLFAIGCNRNDAECLGRIGKLVGVRLEKLKPNTEGALPVYGGGTAKPNAEQGQ